jgi:hypothetical protein
MENNIHLIPTDKPSRLTKQGDDLEKIWLYTRPIDFRANEIYPQHIYITDNSKIREGDWFHLDDAQIIAKYIASKPVNEAKKIILTTDLELQKDGVQSIDDEFLEWFCSKNGKVDFVEVIEIEDEKNK